MSVLCMCSARAFASFERLEIKPQNNVLFAGTIYEHSKQEKWSKKTIYYIRFAIFENESSYSKCEQNITDLVWPFEIPINQKKF